jgi:hypothetical protein
MTVKLMSQMQEAHIQVPPREFFIEPLLSFILSFVKTLGVETERGEDLCQMARAAILLVMENYRKGATDQALEVTIAESHGKLIIEVANTAVPLVPGDTARLGADILRARRASGFFEKLSVENRGRQGQVVSLAMKLGRGAMRLGGDLAPREDMEINDEDIDIRPLGRGEEGALSKLFYHVYEYNYINEIVYYPEKIKEMISDGRLLSAVAALPSGRLIGHLALMRWNDDPPVYEPCFGLTDPLVKGRGIFRKILQRIMDISRTIPMHFCFFDFVTNHDYTQRLVAEYSPCEMAIYVGCQSSETQARLERLGIGEDPKSTDRFSILYSIIPRVEKPFGGEVILPNNLGEMTGFLLKPLNLAWSPAPRFSLLDPGGSYRMHCEPMQGSVVFDCEEPGVSAVEHMVKDWRSLLRDGYQYAAVEVPLDRQGLGQFYDMLAEQGFFIAGFVPYGRTSRLGFRFQAMGPTKVDFGEIRLFAPAARELLDVIKEDYERNSVV